MYDDAGDSLLHVLPRVWPVVTAADAAERVPRSGLTGDIAGADAAMPTPDRASAGSSPRDTREGDFESPPVASGIAERYAVIVNYHYCHPRDAFLRGTNAITPEEFAAQLRALRQNFVCTTIGELTDPAASLPEAVAVVTFDDGLKDVIEYALPLLQRWEVPATIFCSSGPLVEGRMLNVHRGHLLQARLGAARFREEFERELAACGPVALEPVERLGLRDLHVYDDPPTRRFKTLLNFEVPYADLDAILARMFERFVGDEHEIVPKVYMSAGDLRRCLDAGLELGGHGHRHRVHSRLTDAEQRQEIETPADYFRSEFGLSAMPWAYPWGFAGTWNGATPRLLEDAGFASGATMVRAIVKPSDLRWRWELPRFDVKDVFDETGNLRSEPLAPLFTAD
jgi:peptidoglycan/xylan/chitin deacetylase (PgdA/CDA1 family)